MMFSWPLYAIVWLIVSVLVTGCGSDVVSTTVRSITSFQSSHVWLNRVSFRVADDVNDSSPVTVHILIPYKADVYADLLKLSSEDYFAKVSQIKADNTGQLDVFEWDLIRSQRLDDVPIKPSKYSGEGVIVFASYTSPGAHRLTIGDNESVVIQLDNSDFSIQSTNK